MDKRFQRLRVKINDAEPEAVREMLRFLYTGEVGNPKSMNWLIDT
jgi:hypothetical protein